MAFPDPLRLRIYISLAVYVVLPLCALAVGLSKGPENAFAVVIIAGSWLYFFLVGRCDLMGYWFRYALFAILLVAIKLQFGYAGCFVVIGLVAAVWLSLRRLPKGDAPLDLVFPFRGGMYYVGHGGANFMLNHHYRNASQRFAVDLLQINWAGFPAHGILPSNLNKYQVFGQTVHSPCNGVVTAVVDDVADLPVPQRTPEKVAGNHVVIQQDDSGVYVGLAHLRKESVAVRLGEHVTAGQVVGQIGNSGNTSEPHLHIHAKKGGRPDSMLDGAGVPITFRGRWLIRNSLWVDLRRSFAPSTAALFFT